MGKKEKLIECNVCEKPIKEGAAMYESWYSLFGIPLPSYRHVKCHERKNKVKSNKVITRKTKV